MQKFLHDHTELQVSALYALQVQCNASGFPKGTVTDMALQILWCLDAVGCFNWKSVNNSKPLIHTWWCSLSLRSSNDVESLIGPVLLHRSHSRFGASCVEIKPDISCCNLSLCRERNGIVVAQMVTFVVEHLVFSGCALLWVVVFTQACCCATLSTSTTWRSLKKKPSLHGKKILPKNSLGKEKLYSRYSPVMVAKWTHKVYCPSLFPNLNLVSPPLR